MVFAIESKDDLAHWQSHYHISEWARAKHGKLVDDNGNCVCCHCLDALANEPEEFQCLWCHESSVGRASIVNLGRFCIHCNLEWVLDQDWSNLVLPRFPAGNSKRS